MKKILRMNSEPGSDILLRTIDYWFVRYVCQMD